MLRTKIIKSAKKVHGFLRTTIHQLIELRYVP